MVKTYKQGHIGDLPRLKNLALKSWGAFKDHLTIENWHKLKKGLTDDKTYRELLQKSYCIICENDKQQIIGMSFLVPNGNPTEIYDKDWCYLRFVTVDPDYNGLGIGRQLTEKCIRYAIEKGERTIALHTSEIMNKARHIYESLGFKILKELEPRFGKRYWLYILNLI